MLTLVAAGEGINMTLLLEDGAQTLAPQVAKENVTLAKSMLITQLNQWLLLANIFWMPANGACNKYAHAGFLNAIPSALIHFPIPRGVCELVFVYESVSGK